MQKSSNKLGFALVGMLCCLAFAQGVFAAPGDLIDTNPATCVANVTALGRFHCFYNTDYLELRDGTKTFTFDKAFDPTVGGANGDYVVPMLAKLTLSNFAVYTNQCIDGDVGQHVHAIDLLVDDVKVADNYIVEHRKNCFGGGVAFEGAQVPVEYVFAKPGQFTVKVVLATQSNGTCGKVVDEFKVFVVHPLLAINGSSSQVIAFGENEPEKTVYLTWTVTNFGNTIAEVKSVTATGCGPNLECSLVGFGAGFKGLRINPGGSILIVEAVKGKRPGTMPQQIPVNNLGIKAKYTDVYGASDLNKEPETPVRLALLWDEKQRFNVELYGGTSNFCIGKDGRLGGTGFGDVPKVLFAWNWADIDIDTCDRTSQHDLNFVYCDPTQFSIELLKRLNRINRLANIEHKPDGIAQLENFQAYLIGDSFNEDFRKDFDYYVTRRNFLDADWYTADETPWNLYFTNSSKLVFSPDKITSGLYDVRLEFSFQGDKYKFFDYQNALSATITVRLTKIMDPLLQSPFYYLPFNGDVGLSARPGEASAGRTGYGLGYAGDSIMLYQYGSDVFSLRPSSGEKTVNLVYRQDFEESNIVERGLVLSVKKDLSQIKFSPSYATPVIMRVNSSGQRADGYYSVRESGNPVVPSTPYMSLWTGFASSPMPCSNFDSAPLYYRKSDIKASNVPNVQPPQSYGFTWTGIPQENSPGTLFLESTFYTPIESSTNIRASNNSTSLMSPAGASEAISLNYLKTQPYIKSVFDLVENQFICVSLENDALEFWWNPQRLRQDLNAVKAQNINPSWICPVEGETQ